LHYPCRRPAQEWCTSKKYNLFHSLAPFFSAVCCMWTRPCRVFDEAKTVSGRNCARQETLKTWGTFLCQGVEIIMHETRSRSSKKL
jgi:hypothetical protein